MARIFLRKKKKIRMEQVIHLLKYSYKGKEFYSSKGRKGRSINRHSHKLTRRKALLEIHEIGNLIRIYFSQRSLLRI